ncbi:MAG: hypothetical protein AAGJ94_17195 [Pseudomonadota bacterium]
MMMVKQLGRAVAVLGMIGAGFAAVTAASAQTPTEAQRNALRSNCAADFRANCSSVSPGGMDALVCLEQHEASLSPGCKSAVDAVKGGGSSAAPAAGSASSSTAAPATRAPTAGAAPAASAGAGGSPMSLRAEVRMAARECRTDFRRFCPSLRIGGGNFVNCMRQNASRLEPGCRAALARAGAALR